MAVPPPPSDPAKVALRALLRAQRAAHVAAIGAQAAKAAARAAADLLLPHIPEGATVSLYLAMHARQILARFGASRGRVAPHSLPPSR